MRLVLVLDEGGCRWYTIIAGSLWTEHAGEHLGDVAESLASGFSFV